MDIGTFLAALQSIGTSFYALVAYLTVAVIWGINLWRNNRLKLIGDRLESLPETDRLKALELEYRIIPKGGLSPESYLRHSRQKNNLIVILLAICALTLIVFAAIYKSLEESRLSSSIDSISTALEMTKIARSSSDSNELEIAAGRLEAVLMLRPSATAYGNLGYVYEEISNTEAAFLAYSRANELDPGNPNFLIPLGYINKDLGDFDEARAHLVQAIELSVEGSENWFVAMVNLGAVEYEIGRATNDVEQRAASCAIALDQYYLVALRYQAQISNRDLVARSYSNTGNCYKDLADFGRAETYLRRALVIKRRLAASRSLADTLNNNADLLLKQGRFGEAKPFLLEALSIFEALDNDLGIGVTLFNLGDVYWAESDLVAAESYYRRSSDAMITAELGGEYHNAPLRRIERLEHNDPPAFVIDALASRITND
ncbi:tetratricopeptide repeat protein [Yoonia sp. I 8.24]|uniref:tetratricopeptide repeat protein n=1 Tax=Yoonia sp. I 8.24 TaxID=1537229 RepID=UPI001EE0B2C8|nr:tetratricopeptide repeat protein [Yoonia sp. I 8.24]MCG3267133.1 tetratricopeptide repeat protein [Yoonia sp. I 8.24]